MKKLLNLYNEKETYQSIWYSFIVFALGFVTFCTTMIFIGIFILIAILGIQFLYSDFLLTNIIADSLLHIFGAGLIIFAGIVFLAIGFKTINWLTKECRQDLIRYLKLDEITNN